MEYRRYECCDQCDPSDRAGPGRQDHRQQHQEPGKTDQAGLSEKLQRQVVRLLKAGGLPASAEADAARRPVGEGVPVRRPGIGPVVADAWCSTRVASIACPFESKTPTFISEVATA